MGRVSHVRFFHSDWRSSNYSLSLEQEGLLIRIWAYQCESRLRLPLGETQAAHVLGLNPKNFRRVFAELKAAGKITSHADGYGCDRAEAEIAAAAEATSKARRETSEIRTEIVDQSRINPESIANQSAILTEKCERIQTPSKEPISNNQKKARKPLPLEDGSFDRMWEAYPRKVAKVDARKAWQKLSAEDREAAIAALPAFGAKISAARTEEKFIPYPASWLNSRRFEDFSADPSPAVTDSKAYQRQLARHYVRSDDWEAGLGPKPGLPGSIVSPECLAEVRASLVPTRATSSGLAAIGSGHAHGA